MSETMSFQALVQEVAASVIALNGSRLASLFTPDGCYLEPLHGKFQGREEIRRLVDDIFRSRLTHIRWDLEDPVCVGDTGYVHWVFSFSSKLPGLEGKRVAVPGMSLVRLEGNLIALYREEFDVGTVFAQLGTPAATASEVYRCKLADLQSRPGVQQHLQA